MNYRVLNWRSEGIFGGELRFESIDAVCREVNHPRGWESLEQMHAAIRKWAELARPGDVFIVTPIAAIVAAESPPSLQPAEEPDGDWKRCDMTCPTCKEAGHVFYRIWESPWDGYKDMRYECRNCGDAWPVGRAAP